MVNKVVLKPLKVQKQTPVPKPEIPNPLKIVQNTTKQHTWIGHKNMAPGEDLSWETYDCWADTPA